MATNQLLPSQIIDQTTLIGRWTIKSIHHTDTLYSTNLGSLIKFNLTNSTALTIDFFLTMAIRLGLAKLLQFELITKYGNDL